VKTFKDKDDRDWQIELTIGAARRVKDLLGINLLELDKGDPPLLTQLGTDEMLLVDVIYCLIKPQADAAEVTDEMFGCSLDGEAVWAACNAFYAELIDFFRLRGRTDKAEAVKKQMTIIKLSVQKAETLIQSVDLEKTFGTESTRLQASLGLTPAT
jgi:hypothetical protein